MWPKEKGTLSTSRYLKFFNFILYFSKWDCFISLPLLIILKIQCWSCKSQLIANMNIVDVTSEIHHPNEYNVWDDGDIKAPVSKQQFRPATFFQKLEYIIPQLWFFRPWNVYLMEFVELLGNLSCYSRFSHVWKNNNNENQHIYFQRLFAEPLQTMLQIYIPNFA